MTFTLSEFVGAAGGGAMGAALGALLAFSMMGAIVVSSALVATAVASSSALVTGLALGPVFGPHVTFAGGVAAAAYAAARGRHPSGRDIALPLVIYNSCPILLVGAGFGVLGQLVARVVGEIPAFHHHGSQLAATDALAVSVVVTALLAAALWGRGGTSPTAWLPWQHGVAQVVGIGVAAGCATGAVYLAWPEDARGMVGAFVYGFSALTLFPLVFGRGVPVTHHITLPAAMAAGLVAEHAAAPDVWVLVAAAAGGAAASVIAEVWARLMLERSRVHLDPPAFAIAAMTTVVALIRLAVG